MLNTLFSLLLLVSAAPDDGHVTGIFLTIDCHKHIPRKPGMFSAKSVCLPHSPIIYPIDFASVTPVKEIGENIFFDLTFTSKGHHTLIEVTANLPDSHLALIVNDEVFFVFKASDLKAAPTFRFLVPLKYRNEVEGVQRQLVQIMASASGD
jgi:hypothetical protein